MQTVAAIVAGLGIFVFFVNLSIHKIDEGHVGVYYRVGSCNF